LIQESQESSTSEQESQGDNPITMEQEMPNGGGRQPSDEHGEFDV